MICAGIDRRWRARRASFYLRLWPWPRSSPFRGNPPYPNRPRCARADSTPPGSMPSKSPVQQAQRALARPPRCSARCAAPAATRSTCSPSSAAPGPATSLCSDEHIHAFRCIAKIESRSGTTLPPLSPASRSLQTAFQPSPASPAQNNHRTTFRHERVQPLRAQRRFRLLLQLLRRASQRAPRRVPAWPPYRAPPARSRVPLRPARPPRPPVLRPDVRKRGCVRVRAPPARSRVRPVVQRRPRPPRCWCGAVVHPQGVRQT
jgi:hypothetical protein